MSESGDGTGTEAEAPAADGNGVEYGEVAVAVAVAAALVVAAALLPAAGLGGGGTPVSESGTETGTGTPGEGDTPGGGSATATETTTPQPPNAGGLSGGSPSGVSLSNPPEELGIGSTQASVSPLAQTPQFVVEAPQNGYWRQTAYATYTGSTWKGSPRWQSMSEGVPNDDLTAAEGRMDYRVELLVSSSSLPTAWQPDRVGVPNASAGVEASTVGGVRATERLPAGTEYVARSSTPPRSASTLRATGTDYPDRIERRYTQLPDRTPRRVGAFTSDLTAGAETPYAKAVRIRNWLRQKPYSLNASHEAGEPVADQFIFEMERGYCQYYATAMTVMLRTQGIPARYVVGYAGGKAVGEDRYLVTADRGHAWVEVYFPEVGWVAFEPTAAGSLPLQNPQPPYDISLNRSAVAGAHVSISVAKNDTPVVGAPVTVNGERVGWTDGRGRVATTLPYDSDITITARPPSSTTKFDGDETTASRVVVDGTGGVLPVDAGRPRDAPGRFSAARPPAIPLDHGGADANHSSRSYRSDTNVSVSVDGTPRTGGEVTVAAVIRDVPFREATVIFDGERVGATDGNGTYALPLDGVSPGNYTLRVRRASLGATTTIAVRERNESTATPTPTPTPAPADARPPLNLSVSAPLGLPLPGGPATATAMRNGTPVAGASVVVAGATVGTTDDNGTLALSLPLRGSVAVAASGPAGDTARTTLPLSRNAGVAGGGVLVGLAAVGYWLRRRGVTARGASRRLVAALSALAARAVSLCLRAADLLVRLGRALGRGLRWLAGLPARLAAQGLSALTALDPRRLYRRLRRWLAGILARAEASASRGRDAAGSEVSAVETADETAGAPPTLRDLWREFVAIVSPPRARTRTPGEIARYAIDRGLPAEPIRVVTEAYRDAEYGRLTPDDDRLARVREAVRDLREKSGGEGS